MPGRDLALVDSSTLYGEDLRPGDFMALGAVTVTQAEIVEFASRYDPLPIHTDLAAAARGPFGDVIAPAALLLALYSSLASRVYIPRLALVAGKGIDRLRIPTPALPNSKLTGLIVVDQVIHRDDRADVHCTSTFVDDRGRTVLAFTAIQTVIRSGPSELRGGQS